MKLYICVCLIVFMDVLSTAFPTAGNDAEALLMATAAKDETQPTYDFDVQGIATQNRKDDNHADHRMFNLRELLLLKAILDRQLISITTEPPQETEDEDKFDPVFGKLRDFLDELTVEDLERANAKLKSWQAKHENKDIGLPVYPPVYSNPANVDDAISVKKAEYGPCRIEFDKAFASGNINLPYCDENGFFVTKQCSGSICFCVDKNGKPTMGQTPLWRADELVCDKQESVDDAIEVLRGLLDGNRHQNNQAQENPILPARYKYG